MTHSKLYVYLLALSIWLSGAVLVAGAELDATRSKLEQAGYGKADFIRTGTAESLLRYPS
jgi:hypothetical protein